MKIPTWLTNTLLVICVLLVLGVVIILVGKVTAALGTGTITFGGMLGGLGFLVAVGLALVGIGYLVIKAVSTHTSSWKFSFSPLTIAAIATAVLGVGAWAYFGLPTLPGVTASTSLPLQWIAYALGWVALAAAFYMLVVGKKSVAQVLGVIGLLLLVIQVSTMMLYTEKINRILVENAGGSIPTVTTTVADDGIPPLKVIDAVLGMTPNSQRKPQNGCVVAFGPGSDKAHMQLSGGMYLFTATELVQVTLGWFPAQSNKCN